MSNKKIVKKGVTQLQDRIRTIVKEEVRSALCEENVSVWFTKLGGKQSAFAGWLMRQYFNPDKHSGKVWYDDSVTKDNVLEYVTKMAASGVFPQTPKSLYSLFKLKGQLQTSMGQLDKSGELDAMSDYLDDEEDEDEKATYQTGEVSLKDIGKELGGITPTMVNKLAASGMDKFRSLTQGQALDNVDGAALEEFLKKIQDARADAADEFVQRLADATTIGEFIKSLQKGQILSPTDLKLVTKNELEGLRMLQKRDPEVAKQMLMQDIQDDNNLFKSYQAMVSKKVFPGKKRGRPKKIKN